MAGMPARSFRSIRALACLLVISSCSGGTVTVSAEGARATVVRVVDGDTVVLRIAGREESVRLIGVATPETKHPTKPVECFGPEASRRTATLLPVGTRVTVQRDAEPRDVFRRLLLYVYRSDDGLFVNRDLVAGGWAVPKSYPPNTAHAEEFAALAAAAEAAGLGLWGVCPR
ncbi:MAG: thermonuclease family protein [Ilumatobacteraceae bacterium]